MPLSEEKYKTIDKEAKARCQKGIALMNKCMPGWQLKVNLDKLNMRDCCNCVQGQTMFLFRSDESRDLFAHAYGDEYERNYIDSIAFDIDHGFTGPHSKNYGQQPQFDYFITTTAERHLYWDLLQHHWAGEVAQYQENHKGEQNHAK